MRHRLKVNGCIMYDIRPYRRFPPRRGRLAEYYYYTRFRQYTSIRSLQKENLSVKTLIFEHCSGLYLLPADERIRKVAVSYLNKNGYINCINKKYKIFLKEHKTVNIKKKKLSHFHQIPRRILTCYVVRSYFIRIYKIYQSIQTRDAIGQCVIFLFFLWIEVSLCTLNNCIFLPLFFFLIVLHAYFVLFFGRL